MQPLWKRVCWFLKKLNIALPYDLQFHPEELKTETLEDICASLFLAALFTIA